MPKSRLRKGRRKHKPKNAKLQRVMMEHQNVAKRNIRAIDDFYNQLPEDKQQEFTEMYIKELAKISGGEIEERKINKGEHIQSGYSQVVEEEVPDLEESDEEE